MTEITQPKKIVCKGCGQEIYSDLDSVSLHIVKRHNLYKDYNGTLKTKEDKVVRKKDEREV